MARSRRLPITKEEKVALKLSEIVNDYTLDLEEIGRYFYKVAPKVSYNRIIEIVDVAEFEKENANVRHSHYPLF
jgi:protein associated with RNAse G/E